MTPRPPKPNASAPRWQGWDERTPSLLLRHPSESWGLTRNGLSFRWEDGLVLMPDIAPLTPDETEHAIDLWDEANLLQPWNDPRADVAAALACATSTILAARDAGRIVATVMIGYDGHRGWFYYLAVARSHRGTGLGRAIVAAAEHWLVAQGASTIRLMIRTENAAVAGFYRALGYEQSNLIVMGKRFGDG